MRVFVTRHGRSMTNEDLDLNCQFQIGVKNNVLVPAGVIQAQEYGRWIKNESPNLSNIITSPYARTKQTSYLIATELGTLVPIHYDRTFREIDWKIAGRWHRDLESIPGFDHKTMDLTYKPIVDRQRRAYTLESPKEVYDRVVPRFARAVERYAGAGDLLIVTHYFVVKAIQSFMEHGTYEHMHDYDPRNLCQVSFDEEQIKQCLAEWKS